MKTLFRNAVLGLAVAATTLAVVPAEARDRWHRHHSHDDALVAGITGLAVGAIIGGLASQPSPPPARVYIDPPYEPVYRPVPAYRVPRFQPTYSYGYRGLQPWTPAWYRVCSQRYRSFDPTSGTFLGYDGQRHFCTLN